MRVVMDGTELEVSGSSLRDALAAATAAASQRGRVIVDVEADGARVPDEQLVNPSDEAMAAAELQLTSAEPRALVETALGDAADAVDTLPADQRALADRIESGDVQAALGDLGGILQVWQAAHDSVHQGAALLGMDLDTLRIETASGPATASERISALARSLEEVRRSVAERDWTALGDALRYDLEDSARAWVGLLRGMRERVRGAGG
jgi:hypothetical protein